MCVELIDDKADERGGAKAARPLRVAVAGLGVIGEGVALRLLEEQPAFELCAALVRDRAKPRNAALKNIPIVADAEAFLAECPDVIIDALSCGAAGKALIELALAEGAHVVTANKQAIAGSLAELDALARRNGAALSYSASVGGGAPMVETVRKAREAGAVRAITAILNGTVNFILTEIRDGVAFPNAVKAAQIAGFAEPDPTADLSGEDARAKVSILAYEAFGQEPAADAIVLEALDEVRAVSLAEDGRVWKQLAVIETAAGGSVKAGVQYECVDHDTFLKSIVGEENALCVAAENGGAFSCRGKGAGRGPTVESVFSDLKNIRARIGAATSELSLRPAPSRR